jgi:TonB family protein
MFLDRLPALVLCAGAGPLLTLAVLATGSAHSQPAPSGPASAPTGDLTANERAQRDADKVFKWILIHSDKPRKLPPARAEKPAVVAPARPKPAPSRTAEVAAPPTRATEPNARLTGAAAPPTAADAAPGIESGPTTPAGVELVKAAPAANPIGGGAVLTARPAAAEPKPDADEPLTAVLRADPQFPPSLLRTLRKGQVQVRFTVIPDGSVSQRAVVTSTNSRLNEAALAAVAKWRFTPLRHAQEAVVELGFDLD